MVIYTLGGARRRMVDKSDLLLESLMSYIQCILSRNTP